MFIRLAVVIDACSRRVIGWALDRNAEDDLTLAALRMALELRHPPAGRVDHSDRGSLYVLRGHTDLLKTYGCELSLGRRSWTRPKAIITDIAGAEGSAAAAK